MSEPPKSGDLFPGNVVGEGIVAINSQCMHQTGGGRRVVVVRGVTIAQDAVGDRMAEARAMVSLVTGGLARQKDVARAFRVTERTVRRHERRFEEGGLAALGPSVPT